MVRGASAVDRVITPLLLFVCLYVATLFVLGWWRFPYTHWAALIAVSAATAGAVWIWDRGRWPLGLFVPPRLAAPELVRGLLFGCVFIAACAILVVLTTSVRHERASGFPWLEVLIVFLPAAVHEELLFRGYAFQRLHAWNRPFALFFVALLFAALHFRNTAISWIGLTNIFLGGLLLGLAYELYRRLWFPIGLHFAWNVMSGPVLGHEVSGYIGERSLFIERGAGPAWLTGGDFGIEGSAWMTVTEAAAILLLLHRIGKRSHSE